MDSLLRRLRKFQLALLFAAIVCLIMLGSSFVLFFLGYLLTKMGVNVVEHTHGAPLLAFAIISLLIGTVFAFLFSQKPLKPLSEIMKATDRIAEGDYSARLHLKGPKELKQLSQRFNHMAKELASVELLRTDFVNNFSHEFKTPIVSIKGFAKILQREDLSKEQRDAYLKIIINESHRLADLSDQVLALSKLENQVLITDKKTYNVTEQLRLVIAMIYGKWSNRDLTISFHRGEVLLYAQEELMKQLFINLLDNAVKFSPAGSTIKVLIQEKVTSWVFVIKDQGFGMNEETAAHAFDKFYQGDSSHGIPGNGLGLSLVKKIVFLHDGSISMDTKEGKGTTFYVELPKALHPARTP